MKHSDLMRKANAFDEIVKMLDGKHMKLKEPIRILKNKDDGQIAECYESVYEWKIQLIGSSDIKSGLLKLVNDSD